MGGSGMRLIFRTAFVILMLGLSVPVAADPYKDAQAAYDRGDWGTVLRLNKPLADQGNAGAQFILGQMFATGRGVPQNYAEAMKWYRLAADQGNADAQNNIGVMFGDGRGVPENEAEGKKWSRLAADQGHAFAQISLGVMFSKGEGVPQDYVQAHMWFNLAGAGGNSIGKQGRDWVARKMTPAQIAEAQRLAAEWKPKPTQPR